MARGPKKSCIHVAVERQGTANAEVVTGDSYAELSFRVAQAVSAEAHLMTDQLATYKPIGKRYASHDAVNHGAKEFCRGDVHINTAESFNSILERAKQGVFHYLSTRHLPRYVDEVAFRWNNHDPLIKKTRKGE